MLAVHALSMSFLISYLVGGKLFIQGQWSKLNTSLDCS